MASCASAKGSALVWSDAVNIDPAAESPALRVIKLLVTPPVTLTPLITAVVSAPGHGMPANKIPVTLHSLLRPAELNTEPGAVVYALAIDPSSFELPEVDSSLMPAYTSGGYVRYIPPKDLTGYKAVFQARRATGADEVILDLSSDAGSISFTVLEGLIEVSFEVDFIGVVYYDLNLVLPGTPDVVTPLVGGTITVVRSAVHA